MRKYVLSDNVVMFFRVKNVSEWNCWSVCEIDIPFQLIKSKEYHHRMSKLVVEGDEKKWIKDIHGQYKKKM